MRHLAPIALLLAACGGEVPATQPEPTPVPAVAVPAYDRTAWMKRWADLDGDCQDTRQEVLAAESVVPVTMDVKGCRVASGKWIDPYTGSEITEPSAVDIDHMVPLQNAHVSGGWLWDIEKRKQFANNLADDIALTASSQSANRSKGSKGPDQWLPPRAEFRCEYVKRWLAIKEKWGLLLSAAETRAIAALKCEAL